MTKRVLFFAMFFVFILSARVPFAETENSFNGTIDFSKHTFHFSLSLSEETKINTHIIKIKEGRYQLLVKVEHLKTPFFDFSSEIASDIEVKDPTDDGSPVLEGKIWSRYTLIDYKPARDLNGTFSVIGKRLHLKDLSLGGVNCSGYMDLQAPHKINAQVKLLSIGMDEFLNFWVKNKTFDVSGPVNGDIKITGNVKNPYLAAKLKSENGLIKKFDFKQLTLNMEGPYPVMAISESFISKADGTVFAFQGPFDLSKTKNFKQQISELKLSPIVSDSQDQSEWTIKRFSQEDSGSMEFKYFLKKGEDIDGTGTTDDAAIIGVQRTLEF